MLPRITSAAMPVSPFTPHLKTLNRQRTHAEVSAENRRMVDAHESEDRDVLTLRRRAEALADRSWHPSDDSAT